MKKCIALWLFVVFVVALIPACSFGADLPKVRIGWAPPNITGVFKTATDFMEKAALDAKSAGIDVEIITRAEPDETQVQNQVNALENLVQLQVDCIICSPGDAEAIKPALQTATDAGIPIILVNMLEPQEGITAASYIGFDNQMAGTVSGYALLDALGGPGVLGEGEKADVSRDDYLDLAKWSEIYANFDYSSIKDKKVAVIEGIAGNFYSNARLKGFHEVVDKAAGIKIVATLPADWDRQKGIAATENILQSNAELDAIWSASNEMGIGSSIACENLGRSGIILTTNDGTPESIDMIREGKLMAETWHGFPEWGWYGTYFAVQLAYGQGADVPPTFDVRPRIAYRDNVDNFYPNTKLENLDWASVIAKYGQK
ncbi:MAG: sugar ABC transporter substrate-binding protein [Synergistaceae bacterium]|jgi:ribose transport system substrate-binding protein|nr:sugar ABC transporter substrate-binding protein [Synergistaceae bacterium]